MSKPPKKPKGDRFTAKWDGRGNQHRVTVDQVATNLYFSVLELEAAEGSQMPHTLLADAYEMAEMLIEAEGIEPHEKLVDTVVYHYLKKRQQLINTISKDLFKKQR
jgi:hypothetical protein